MSIILCWVLKHYPNAVFSLTLDFNLTISKSFFSLYSALLKYQALAKNFCSLINFLHLHNGKKFLNFNRGTTKQNPKTYIVVKQKLSRTINILPIKWVKSSCVICFYSTILILVSWNFYRWSFKFSLNWFLDSYWSFWSTKTFSLV